jgi:dTDP-4-amino-4,6-dideoxygalactose transaminase
MAIKFVDLAAQNREIAARVRLGFAALDESCAYVGGADVEAFEREFASYLGVRCVVGVSSGTDALRLALIGLGIGPGDEVITAPATFIATAEAIVQAGARPVFVDIDPATNNLSLTRLEEYLHRGRFSTPHGPRAIVPVDLYGMPAPTGEIAEIARRHGLAVIEDACQAHGARVRHDGRWFRAGSLGDAGCFSFYPGKNLGAWGEGGAVATNDEELAERIASLRDHGRLSHYRHRALGYNARLDTIQSIVLRAKLEHLERWNARRREVAALYRRLLSECPALTIPAEFADAESSHHLYVIRSARREAIRNALSRASIQSGIHYPVPLHLQPALGFLGYREGEFPVSEALSLSALSLPMHPHLTDDEVREVAGVVREAASA